MLCALNMGLDGVEIVMEIEDEFGITIPDSEAAGLRTVGDLTALCLARIRATKAMRCPSLQCFLALRTLVREIRSEPHLKLRPSDRVDACLQAIDRKRFWRRLPELLKTSPPALRRPAWLRRTLVAVVLVAPILLISVLPLAPETLVLICFGAVANGVALFLLTMRFRSRTPKGYATFGDITKRIAGLEIAMNPPAEADYESVFSIVKRVVVEQLNVKSDVVTPSARFVEDLGIG